MTQEEIPLGYETARRLLKHGRKAFFSSVTADLPQNRTPEIAQTDLLPQFGFVGEGYTAKRVLVLGINPGNGDDHKQNEGDKVMMPLLKKFVEEPTPHHFGQAQKAYQEVCSAWPIWKKHGQQILEAGQLQLDDIAYSNCLPWRTASEGSFGSEVAQKAAVLFAYPLIDELQPRLIVALGKKAADILQNNGRSFSNLVVWNRSRAATPAVVAERQAAAQKIASLLGL